jgi:hypothetical protein
LITLRNAQVRRISWVRGVRPARGGASGLLMTPLPAGHHSGFFSPSRQPLPPSPVVLVRLEVLPVESH